MTIGLVLNPFDEERPSGLGRAVAALTNALMIESPHDSFLLYTKKTPHHEVSFPGSAWKIVALGDRASWLEGLRSAPLSHVYVFFTPVMPLFFKPKKSVVIVHDLGYLELPTRSVRELWNRFVLRVRHMSAVRHATHVVAVSEATKRDIIKHFGIPKEKITVIYDGTNDFSRVVREPVPTLPERFFLFAGVVKERKNVLNLIQAFAKLQGTEHLVIAGKTEGKYAEKVRMEAAKLCGRVHFLGFVTDGQLGELYHRALAFVYPSLVEGFGMAVIEAMTCGAPVITSNTPALKEAAGTAALLVDPFDTNALAAAMQRIIEDPSLRADLARRGRERSAQFSWSRAGQELRTLLS
jgi:glycosyltransferase involved in cell wall biosynthesis